MLVALSAAVGAAFLISVGFKFAICMSGARFEYYETVSAADVAALRDVDLPVYTVLVPVYREANVVGDLVANLGALDYPPAKLQILLLLEEEDDETREAAKAARPPQTITFVTIPAGSRRPSRRRATSGCSWPRASSWSSTTRRTSPTRTSSRRPWSRSAAAGAAWPACRRR